MVSGKYKVIKEHDKGIRTSFFTRKYIYDALRVYKYNENVSRSAVINKAVEEFLIKEGYLDGEGNVIMERII